jgi:hypothetical protein
MSYELLREAWLTHSASCAVCKRKWSRDFYVYYWTVYVICEEGQRLLAGLEEIFTMDLIGIEKVQKQYEPMPNLQKRR